jgi:hypothetical protein
MPTAMRVFSLASHIRSIPKHRRSPAGRTGLYHKTDARLIFFRRPIYSRSLFFSIAGLGQKFLLFIGAHEPHRDDEFHYTENSALVFCDTE